MTRRTSPFAFPTPSAASSFSIAKINNHNDSEITEDDVTALIKDAEAKHSKKPEAITIEDDSPIEFLGPSASDAEDAASSQAPTSGDKRPPVYNKQRGSKKMGMDIMKCSEKRKAALEAYRKDKRSAGYTS